MDHYPCRCLAPATVFKRKYHAEVLQPLKAWSERLAQRENWQQTAAPPEAIAAALPNIRKILQRRS